MVPIVLTIAGSDSGGGAEIQADLKTFSALGAYGASVINALTAQNTRNVSMVEPASPAMIAAQIDAVFDDLDVRAVKLGMLGGPESIATVAEGLAGRDLPVVLDPVMVAKSGDRLLPQAALTWRMGGFRFDRAPEPEQILPFIARSQIRAGDMLIDLRAEAVPFCPDARHVAPEAIATLAPRGNQRVVLACATGLRAQNAGATLQACWLGEIALLALND